jgi:outer membrane protein TolC
MTENRILTDSYDAALFDTDAGPALARARPRMDNPATPQRMGIRTEEGAIRHVVVLFHVVTMVLAWAMATSAAAQTAVAKRVDLAALTLGQAFDAALNNDDMAVARSNAAAAKSDVAVADRAPFPTLSAKLSSIDLQNGIGDGNLITDKRIDKGLGVDWVWERGGKRDLRTKGARRVAEAAQRDLEETQLQQLLAASGAFFDLAAAQDRP